jgi:hypothetical protein
MRNLILAVLAGVALAGCYGEKDYGTTLKEPPDPQKEIERIQADPSMPQQAKDIAIGQIKSRMGESQQRADVTKKGG